MVQFFFKRPVVSLTVNFSSIVFLPVVMTQLERRYPVLLVICWGVLIIGYCIFLPAEIQSPVSLCPDVLLWNLVCCSITKLGVQLLNWVWLLGVVIEIASQGGNGRVCIVQ